ncbi:MAG: Nre family DNA repair protein [Candidatus Korarchaeum sp.]
MKKLKILSDDYRVVDVVSLELLSELRIPKVHDSPEIAGSSPPEIFVGRFGYPKVYAGPLVPPIQGDTRHLATPEEWFGRGLSELIDMRLQLIRGKREVRVDRVEDRYASELREALLSEGSVDTEVKLRGRLRGCVLSEDLQPFGPSALIEELRMEPGRADPRLERAYYDRDATATEAVIELYKAGLRVSRIQQALSAGLLGRRRKFVPTRWAITAVDDLVSRHILNEVRGQGELGEYRVYRGEYLNNRWVVVMMPGEWSYESIEAWFPGVISGALGIAGDYEPFWGRSEYASMGGCYYAGRLAVAEKLREIGKQASVLILREVYPGYVPLGVWNVRETLRNILMGKPETFSSLEESLEHVKKWLSLPMGVWFSNSRLLRKERCQVGLERFL